MSKFGTYCLSSLVYLLGSELVLGKLQADAKGTKDYYTYHNMREFNRSAFPIYPLVLAAGVGFLTCVAVDKTGSAVGKVVDGIYKK